VCLVLNEPSEDKWTALPSTRTCAPVTAGTLPTMVMCALCVLNGDDGDVIVSLNGSEAVGFLADVLDDWFEPPTVGP
jgi:hypothetical protein